MGKGKAQRRRLQNALKANQGNLAKAQLRKASAYLPLPDAPKPNDLQEKLPGSLRKLLALKAVVEEANARTKKQPQQQQQSQQSPQQHLKAEKPAPTFKGGSSAIALEAAAAASRADGVQTQAMHASTSAQKAAGGAKGGSNDKDVAAMVPAFEQPKKLKQRKKEYLNAKKHKKKQKGKTQQDPDDKEAQLVDHVRFGERVDAPLKVHLKRKHWDAAAVEKKAAERCKAVFMRQMEQASKRMPGGPGHGAGRDDGRGAPGTSKGAQLATGAAQQQREQQHEERRQAAIDAYRAKRGRNATDGAASLRTLKTLVAG